MAAGRMRGSWLVQERQERWKTMPTDHAPELAALGKRLADAKEFL
jgi:hypothetical protein